MTSDTIPNVIYSTEHINTNTNSGYAYYTFCNDESKFWMSSNSGLLIGSYVGYNFGNPIKIRKYRVKTVTSIKLVMQIKYSDDGENWNNCGNTFNLTKDNGIVENMIPDCGYHKYWIFYMCSASGDTGVGLQLSNFYGRYE